MSPPRRRPQAPPSSVLLLLASVAAVAAGPAVAEAQPRRPEPTAAPLQSGPMVGHSTMREVLLWAQTTRPATVHFEYWVRGRPGRRWSTDTVRTREDSAFTARAVADRLQPGTTYRYAVYVDGEEIERPYPLAFRSQALWQWRRDPPEFTMALGSCAYVNDGPYDRPGEPYGGGYGVFRSIHEDRPDLMLWLGDNTYLREADWNSRTGVLYRYTHSRSLPELQPLLGSTHHYATWDDHDYGPNNSNRSWWNRRTTLEAFRLFWANPAYGVDGNPGVTSTFRWADVRVFLLDDRYHRAPNRRTTGERTMLGAEQIRWLVDALVSSDATFKLVALGGQFLNPHEGHETYANRFPAERQQILERLRQEGIPGVVFVTGDRHFTELSRLERPDSYPLYDLTVSPLTSSPNEEGDEEPNFLRVPETAVTERNYALLRFAGPRDDRRMTISVRDTEGEEIWARTIRARDLR